MCLKRIINNHFYGKCAILDSEKANIYFSEEIYNELKLNAIYNFEIEYTIMYKWEDYIYAVTKQHRINEILSRKKYLNEFSNNYKPLSNTIDKIKESEELYDKYNEEEEQVETDWRIDYWANKT